MKIEESLNVTFDETPPPSKTSPLVDDDLDEEEAIRETEKKNLENVVEDETLEIDEIVNIKESRNHPLENVIGNLNQRTLRLVAQGYNQHEGIDYDEMYAPVARLESIRILLAYVCALDFKLFQMDVKSAFLNGFINEEVYVAKPLGFTDFEKPDHVYKLKKALYGLKQASKSLKSSNLIIVQIYVDDIIFGSTCQYMCDEFAKIMHDEFEMSMMGELNFFLRLQIQSLASKELVRNLPKLKFDQHFCDACKMGKQAHASPKAKNIVSTTRCLELFHMDLFGPFAVRSYRGNRYTLVIVDDYSSKHTKKVEESLNVTFDETPPPSKTSPLVDDDLDEEEAIRETEKKNLKNVRMKH
ncbi:retrovirus-related pol polyprotein from transposon TNT 1-94 [Tanacetum coccineum]